MPKITRLSPLQECASWPEGIDQLNEDGYAFVGWVRPWNEDDLEAVIYSDGDLHLVEMNERFPNSKATVAELLEAIVDLDCEPGVFRAWVEKPSYNNNFFAFAEFRTYDRTAVRSMNCAGDTPEEALANLLTVLRDKFGRCSHCGRHPLEEAP